MNCLFSLIPSLVTHIFVYFFLLQRAGTCLLMRSPTIFATLIPTLTGSHALSWHCSLRLTMNAYRNKSRGCCWSGLLSTGHTLGACSLPLLSSSRTHASISGAMVSPEWPLRLRGSLRAWLGLAWGHREPEVLFLRLRCKLWHNRAFLGVLSMA